nr:hypothetical protein [Selenomonas sp.]
MRWPDRQIEPMRTPVARMAARSASRSPSVQSSRARRASLSSTLIST